MELDWAKDARNVLDAAIPASVRTAFEREVEKHTKLTAKVLWPQVRKGHVHQVIHDFIQGDLELKEGT